MIPDLLDYIEGQWVKPTRLLDAWVTNPNTNDRLQQQAATDDPTLERALQAASESFPAWAATSIPDRLAALEKMAQYLEGHLAEISQVESMTTGVIINLTSFINVICHLAFRAAAGQLQTGWTNTMLPGEFGDVELLRKPWGPAALIVPWNAPAPLAAHKLANALAAGCTAILKPSEWAPHSCAWLAHAAEAAGLPKGVFQIVHGGGNVGAKLVSDSRITCVSFTGGLNSGRAVAAACARDFKPMQLELGGNNAMIVLDDADLDLTAEGVATGLSTLNGQWCRALGRLLIHKNIYHDMLERSLDRLREVKMGDSMSRESHMGPLVHAGHFQTVQRAAAELERKGGAAHRPTPLPASLPNGNFLSPTLITGCQPNDTLEEIFGPVAAVHPFATEDEAVALANLAPYGLAGYVYTRDEDRGRRIGRQLRTGDMKVNGIGLMGLHPMAPRPAWNLSGFGEEGTEETFRFFCGTSTVGVAYRRS